MRSETCNEILMEKVAFYESDWDMPDSVRIPDANGGSRRVRLDSGFDPDAAWADHWKKVDFEDSLKRRKGRISKTLKGVLKHASMRQAAVRRGVGGGHAPGSAIPKGVVRASEEAHQNWSKSMENIRKFLDSQKVTKQAFASPSKPDMPFGAKSLTSKRQETVFDRLMAKKY
jgi:hypothetical protein